MIQEKIQKILAKYGYGSRRYIETLIKLKLVQVNNKIVNIGQRISLKTIKKVIIDQQKYLFKVNQSKYSKVLLYNKCEGELCTYKDPRNRKTVFEKLPYLNNSKWISVGRLDINSSGLLLFTTDGMLAHRLMHPSFNIRKIYKVRVFGNFTSDIIEKLSHGVYLSDGYASFQSVQFQYGYGKNKWFNVSLCEGRNRIVRRVWEKLGFKVSKLIRISYADFALPKTLFPGNWIELSQNDVNTLYIKVNLK